MLPQSFTADYLRRIEQFRIQTRRAFLGSRQGGHISLRRGHGIEFADYRKYELGDSIRYIDWNTYARSDRLYVKQFREEEDLNVLLLLDTSASMFVDQGKWQMARDVALTLAYLALQQQDKVTLSALGQYHSPNCSGAKAFHELADGMLKLEPVKFDDFLREVRVAVARIKIPGKAVFISDFLMPLPDLEKTFNVLRAKNLDITAIQVLAPSDLDPLVGVDNALAVDSETGEEVEVALDEVTRTDYQDMLNTHVTSFRTFLQRSQISFTQMISDQELLDSVIENLSSIGLLR